MERISAACAMEWSIELEKGLRSNKPGQPIEAILQTGSRLERWSKEPVSTMAISNIFGLVTGEDRLFANTILLRLADAFKSGNKLTRMAILNAFLTERNQHKKGNRDKGILSKQRVPNHVELLKRAKIAYNAGDVESRSITLRLLGCWSDFAKDSAEIHHMVLLSLGSSHDLEVKASIFTAGCFSELSKDFAYIFLEVLINKVTSSKTSNAVKLACAKAFAKLGCSLPLASRAHKIGRKLVLDYPQEDFRVEMLVSLSKLASKSMLLISEHVDFLLSYITPNSGLHVKAMAIRCILFLLARGVCCFPKNANLLAKLFRVLNDANLPTIPQCEALRILLKIFESTQPKFSFIEVPEIVTWMALVENATQSPLTSKRLLDLHLMVGISLKCRTVSAGNVSLDFPARVLLLILDQAAQLEKSVPNPCESSSKSIQKCQTLLSLVLRIVEEFPTLGALALNKTKSCIDSLLNVENRGIADVKVVFCMYTFVEHCLETLSKVSVVTPEVLQILKLILEILRRSYFSNHDKCSMHLILLHSRVTSNYLANNTIGISCTDYYIDYERLTHQFVKKLIDKQDNWAVYKAGKCAACQGSWFAAAFTFGKLINSVQSNACQNWLKSLALFAKSESTIMALFRPDKVQIDEIWGTRYRNLKENIEDNFSEAYNGVLSALEMLTAIVTADQNFIFPRWFLNLRAKVLKVVVDILKLLKSNISNMQQNINSFTLLSFHLKKLAQELDLLATSFLDIDLKSCRSVSKLALDCSLMAFCTGFVLYFPNLHSHGKSSHSALVQDLSERLWHLEDCEMSTNLMEIATLVGEPESCNHTPPRFPVHKAAGTGERGTLDVCKFALSSFVLILKEAKGTKDERLQLLSNILKKWMNLSFHVPKYFFQMKSCVGAELYVFNADTKNPHGLSVSPGSHLSLNLCLQLKHVPCGHVTKVHCILASKPSHWTPERKGKVGSDFQFSDINDTLDLNEKLWRYVTEEGAIRSVRKLGRVCSGDGLVCSFVSFVLNDRGQGFSSCLLDVLGFPVGSYRIKWLSCCIDSKDSYWSLVPLNMGPIFSVKKESVTG